MAFDGPQHQYPLCVLTVLNLAVLTAPLCGLYVPCINLYDEPFFIQWYPLGAGTDLVFIYAPSCV